MSTALLLPRLGETMEQGRVVAWLKKPGDSFVRGETIVEIETDKTVVELPALADGVLRRIAAEVGEDVDVGASLGDYDAIGGEADVEPEASAEIETEAVATPVEAPAPAPVAANIDVPAANGSRLRATPHARQLARRNGIDLATLTGTGRRARIQGHDVEAAMGGGATAAVASAEGLLFRDLPAGRIAYREWRGAALTGLPVVLLHGFAGDSQAWAVLASQLQRAGRHVIAPDLPSHGATGFDRNDPAAMAEAIHAFIDGLGLPPIELVGHSLGGAVAVRVATLLGARVQRLTLIAPAGLGSEIDGDFIDGMAGATLGGGIAHQLRRISLNPPPLSPQQLDQMASAVQARGALAPLAASLVQRGRQQIDITAQLAALGARARVVWGLDDRIIPWQHATHAGPGTPVFFIPQAGHMPQWDQPQKVAALFA